MTAHTLADYLDCLNAENRMSRDRWRRLRDLPGFPVPDKLTGMYYRPAVDRWLAQHFGDADPVAISEADLDRRYGT